MIAVTVTCDVPGCEASATSAWSDGQYSLLGQPVEGKSELTLDGCVKLPRGWRRAPGVEKRGSYGEYILCPDCARPGAHRGAP